MMLTHFGKSYSVQLVDQYDDRLVWIEDNHVHVVSVGSDDTDHVLRQAQRWQEREAKAYLTRRVRELSERTGFEARRVTFRRQRSRWGSCTVEKNLSLNLRLIELPEHLIEYVIIHELAHTRELNHSRLFWDLVAEHCPDYRKRDRELDRIAKGH